MRRVDPFLEQARELRRRRDEVWKFIQTQNRSGRGFAPEAVEQRLPTGVFDLLESRNQHSHCACQASPLQGAFPLVAHVINRPAAAKRFQEQAGFAASPPAVHHRKGSLARRQRTAKAVEFLFSIEKPQPHR